MLLTRPNSIGYLETLSAGDHPAQVDVFSDWGSLAHILYGLAAAALPAPWQLAAVVCFLGYQVSQAATGESWQRTGGELLELALGIALEPWARQAAERSGLWH
jgi:hypothetical protein